MPDKDLDDNLGDQVAARGTTRVGQHVGKYFWQTYTFYARFSEILWAVFLVDQTPRYEGKCYFFSQICYVQFILVTARLILLSIKLNPLDPRLFLFRSLQIVDPWKLVLVNGGALGGGISSYYTFFGGCEELLQIFVFFGGLTCAFYFFAALKKE